MAKGNQRPHRQKLKIVYDRMLVAELYLKGETLHKIAQIIGIGKPSVDVALRELRQEWVKNSTRDFAQMKAEQLEKLDLVENEAWKAWQRSQESSETITTTEHVVDIVRKANGLMKRSTPSKKDKGKEVVVRVEGQVGDARFLDIVGKCIAKRCEILGLNAPTQYDVNDISERQEEIRARLMSRLKQIGTTAPEDKVH